MNYCDKNNIEEKNCEIKELCEFIINIFGKICCDYDLHINIRWDKPTDPEIKTPNIPGYLEYLIMNEDLPKIDLFVPEPGFVIALDNKYHFNNSRRKSLIQYPELVRTGFDRKKWCELCLVINGFDNSIPFTEGQIALLDTFTDYAPYLKPDLIRFPTFRINVAQLQISEGINLLFDYGFRKMGEWKLFRGNLLCDLQRTPKNGNAIYKFVEGERNIFINYTNHFLSEMNAFCRPKFGKDKNYLEIHDVIISVLKNKRKSKCML